MVFKNLEHDGTEDFLKDSFPNRRNHAQVTRQLEDAAKAKEDSKDTKQAEWLNLNNPFIWEGEI